MALKYFVCLWLIAAPISQGTPASNAVNKSTVEINIKTLSIPLGHSRSITCNPGGNPVPTTIEWIKNGGAFSTGTIQSGHTLSIFDATKKDEGEYICLGLVDRKIVAQERLTVEIDDKSPTVAVSVPRLVIQEGDSGFVDCDPSGSPTPRVQWTRGNGRFSSRTTQNGNRLIISDAKQSDEGIYICNAMVESAPIWTDYVKVEVEPFVAPLPTSTPVNVLPANKIEEATTVAPTVTPRVTVVASKLRVVRGQSAAIDCIPEGSPLPAVKWTKENGKFGKETRQVGNTLIISNMDDSDIGNYVCSGLVEATVVWMDYAQVLLKEPATMNKPSESSLSRVEVNAASVKVVRGHSAAIDCNPKGSPLPSVEWSREHYKFNDRVRKVGNTLVISDAQYDDAGLYACDGYLNGKLIWADYVHVNIVEEDPFDTDKFDIIVSEGPDTKVRCDLEFVADDHSAADKELVVRIASKERSGYRCTVSGHQLALQKAQLHLEVLPPPQPPKIIVRPESKVVSVGQPAFIECLVLNGEGVKMEWKRADGLALSSRVQARGSKLVFHNIKSEDAGTYQCVAKNGAGEASGYSHLSVTGLQFNGTSAHDPIVVIKRQIGEVYRGSTYSVECKPFGFPLPTVQWKKGEGNFRDGVKQEGNWLVISNAVDSDAGDYVCDALVEATPVWTDYARVVIKDRCHEAYNGGATRCHGNTIRWFYDYESKQCRWFFYTGCGGNQNNFLSEAGCRRACDVSRTPAY